MIFGSFRKFILAKKKIDHFPDIFHMPTKSMRISLRFFFILEKSEKSQSELRFQIKPDERISVGFCSFWNMFELKMETFEKLGKIKIFGILGIRYAAEAIIAHQNFCAIFAIWRIFSVGNGENRFFLALLEKANVQLHHISKWANSDRNSLIWLKLKSERSSQKQHFSSHFKQFKLKMRCEVLNVVLKTGIQSKNKKENRK